MCIAIICSPNYDVINFEINLSFLIKPFLRGFQLLEIFETWKGAFKLYEVKKYEKYEKENAI